MCLRFYLANGGISEFPLMINLNTHILLNFRLASLHMCEMSPTFGPSASFTSPSAAASLQKHMGGTG